MSNPPPSSSEAIADDFFEQIFSYVAGDGVVAAADGGMPIGAGGGMALQLASGEGGAGGGAPPGMVFGGSVFPLGLSLDQGRDGFVSAAADAIAGGKRLRGEAEASAAVKAERDPIQLATLFPAFPHVQAHQVRPSPPSQVFHAAQNSVAPGLQPPAPRPRVRARRGQATDPHSIAERLRRERIAERMRALQELLPNSNKTDRAAMLDEILDYVKFLKLQVKVLSMSRLGGAGAVAQLVADIPLSSVEGDASEGGSKQQVWEKWSTDGTERQVAKLMEEDIGAAMQFLQSKALCIMPISLATTIYHSHHQSEPSSTVESEPNMPS